MESRSSFAIRHREFDYLQLHWLEKTTGRASHEWDLYVIKELLDNALDADGRWACKHDEVVELDINLNYRHVDELDIHSLEIAVSNRAPFPTNLLPSIFDLNTYTSDKSHYNYPSRGQQGNALKTLLGIPYALRHAFYGDYFNIRKPLVIETGNQTYVIGLQIDEIHQTVKLAPIKSTPLNPPCDGTCVRIGIDRFIQERPRTLTNLHAWAQCFSLLNPHIVFHWHVRISGEEVEWDFTTAPDWDGLFDDMSPVHWYEYTQLRELLLVLERQQGPDVPLPQVLQAFAGFAPTEDPNGMHAKDLCNRIGFQALGDLQLTNDHVHTLRDTLWPALLRIGRRVPAERLGGLGERYMVETLTRFYNLEKAPLYRRIVHDDPTDPAHPFVLELALARLPSGQKRIIWTGLNHTPTYEDPFYSRRLFPAILEHEPVFGLDGFLDAYGQTTEQPVLLILHLICPNFAYQDFSKSGIETRPFRDSLAVALDEMLTAFGTVKTEQFEDLQALVHDLIPQAISLLSPNGQQYVAPQLLRTIRRLLGEYLRDDGQLELAEAWLGDPMANARLQGYIQVYARDYPEALSDLIRPERGRLSLPVHPEGHVTFTLSHISHQIMDEACVNKILLTNEPELEAVVIANGLLARFDMALLRTDGDFDSSFEALLPYLDWLDLPLVLLHHATPSGCVLAERLRTRLTKENLARIELYDIGLTPAQGYALNLPVESGAAGGDRNILARYLATDEVAFLIDHHLQMSLFSLTADELSCWLEERFNILGLMSKFIPAEKELRAAALNSMRRIVTDRVLYRFQEVIQVDSLVDRVIQTLSSDFHTDGLSCELRESLRKKPLLAWHIALGELIGNRCQEILATRQDWIDQLLNSHKQSLAVASNKKGVDDESPGGS